jgi:membrane fusion protein, multidrug efflux system
MNNLKPLLALAALSLVAACGEKAPPPDAAQSGPRLVRAMKVGAGETASEYRYSGEVRSRHETQLAFRIGGKIIARLVDAGAQVKAGQPLARLDPADAQLAVTQADANRTLAEAELKRTQELRQKNFISQAALDAKESVAKTTVAQARLAQNQAAYTTLAADAPGVIAAVFAEPGQVVGAGQAVFRVARDGEREVAIAIPESRLASLKVGDPATVELWAGKAYQGRLRELTPMADAASRTFAARVAILDAAADLPLGMTATVSFARADSVKIIVPLAAILQQGDKAAVWVIGADGALTQRPIDIERYADSGAVLKAGLNVGETIVAAGAYKLVAGEKVRIAEEPGR